MSEIEQVSKEADVEQDVEEVGKLPVRPGSLIDTRIPMDVNISPDGKRVAYTIYERVADRPKPRFRIWIVGTVGIERAPLTDQLRETFAPRWSPDGQKIAFIGKNEGEKSRPGTGEGTAWLLITFVTFQCDVARLDSCKGAVPLLIRALG